MAIIGLTILYCLNLTLSNGRIKQFELHTLSDSEEKGYYYTPANCNSEDAFWIRQSNDTTHGERSSSRVDFRHREYLAGKQEITTNEWTMMYFTLLTNLSIKRNDAIVIPYENIGLNEGDKIRLKYTNMSEPLNFVYGKCSQINETLPAEVVTVSTTHKIVSTTLHLKQTESTTLQKSLTQTLNQTESTIQTVNHSTTLQLNRDESTSYEPSQKNMLREPGDIENLEEIVKVLNEEMETLKLKMKQPKPRISNTSGLPRLTIFTVLFVVAISIVLAFTIYQRKLQDKKIKTLSIDVNRYRSEIEVPCPIANRDW